MSRLVAAVPCSQLATRQQDSLQAGDILDFFHAICWMNRRLQNQCLPIFGKALVFVKFFQNMTRTPEALHPVTLASLTRYRHPKTSTFLPLCRRSWTSTYRIQFGGPSTVTMRDFGCWCYHLLHPVAKTYDSVKLEIHALAVKLYRRPTWSWWEHCEIALCVFPSKQLT